MPKEVAYVPLSEINPKQVAAPTKIDIPSYPDPGVAFAGYSKKLYSGNEYRLIPQRPADLTLSIAYAGGETSTNLGVFSNEEDFYVTDLVISGLFVAGTVGQLMRVFAGGELKFAFRTDEGIQTIVMKFTVPLRYPAGVPIIVGDAAGRLVSETITLNFFGWFEKA